MLLVQESPDNALWSKRALTAAKKLANARWKESEEASPLFTDLFAPQLAVTVSCTFVAL